MNYQRCFLIFAGIRIPQSAEGTADFLLFFDQLFDSVNGLSVNTTHGKLMRTAIRKNSPHHNFWSEAVSVLQLIKFIAANG